MQNVLPVQDDHDDSAPRPKDPATRMLVVEDDEDLAIGLQDFFAYQDYEVTVARDGEEALMRMRGDPPFDIVLLDVTLPKKNGYEVLQASQELGLASPVLMLTARGAQNEILKAFGLGAADYVVKPFRPEELAERVRALVGQLPLSIEALEDTFLLGSVQIDFRGRRAERDAEEVPFSEMEFDLLSYLVRHRGQIVTHRRLLRDVWGIDEDLVSYTLDQETLTRTIERHINELRQKVEPEPSRPAFIRTVYGLGYRLEAA